MPEPYRPAGSDVEYTVPSLDDPADGPLAFRDFADSIPTNLSPAIVVHQKDADCTLCAADMGCLVEVDTTAGDHTVTVPNDADAPMPIGTVIVVGNVGKTRKRFVSIVAASGVTIKDMAVRKISLYRMAALIKVDANYWIINAGTGGGETGSVPMPPVLKSVTAQPTGASLAWEAPSDDGGFPVTTYIIEKSTDEKNFTTAGTVAGGTLTAEITGLTAKQTTWLQVRAVNEKGPSDPSNVMSVVPKAPFNEVQGGTVGGYTKDGKTYKTHTFTASQNMTVLRAVNPFMILAVGGGYGGGIGDYAQYGGGGGGVTQNKNVLMAVGDVQVTVGGPNGGTSSVGAYVSAPGAAGGNGVPGPGGGNGGPNGGGGGNGSQSDIATGSPIWYSGGGGSVEWNYCCPARGGEGGLGGGGAWDCGRQNASYYGGGGGRVQHTCPNHGSGYQGIVVVAYEIDPSEAKGLQAVEDAGQAATVLAQVSHAGNMVVNTIAAEQGHPSEEGAFYYVPTPAKDGSHAHVGYGYDPDKQHFSGPQAEPMPTEPTDG